MTIQQISVFLENKLGRLNEILSLIAKENIRIVAGTVSDTTEFGILRIITSNPHRAYQTLKNNKISANLSEVFAIVTEPEAGKFAEKMNDFTHAGINIEYMYCFSIKEKALMIIRTNNVEATREVIRKKDIEYINEAELSEI